MTEHGAFLARQIVEVHEGDPWHGPSVRAALAGLSAGDAAERPIADAHTVWELVRHLTAWTGEVSRRLEGGEPALPVEGDWPAVDHVSEEAWARDLAALDAAHATLAATVRELSGSALDAVVGATRDAPLGAGTTVATMVAGLALHDAYHAGQIALLRRAATARPR